MAKFVVKKNRILKAMKIESVVCNFIKKTEISNCKILDIGCGTGEIIDYFNKNDNRVYAIDVMNQLKENIKLPNFTLTDSAILPFDDETFDVIISNHVIEHIKDQDTHMSEIRRCLKSNGLCYFTTPNWNFMIEPHHTIPFLHYFGSTIFHTVLKIFGIYEEDLYLLSYQQMKKSFKKYKFYFYEYTATIMKNPNDFYLQTKLFKFVPKKALKYFQFLIPTNIFILFKKNNNDFF